MNTDRSKIYNIRLTDNDPRTYSINWIDKKNAKVLDVGCACGDFVENLKKLKEVSAWGMDYNQGSLDIAEKTKAFEELFQVDLNNFDENKYSKFNSFFDYIVFGDVLEHIINPEKVLEVFKKLLKKDGCFLISLPNVAHASIKANLLIDNFDYTENGLLDKTHVRFFTYKTIAKFYADLNLEILDYKYTNWAGIKGTQLNNPYKKLPFLVKRFILKDPHSHVCQYVTKLQISDKNIEELNEKNLKILKDGTKGLRAKPRGLKKLIYKAFKRLFS